MKNRDEILFNSMIKEELMDYLPDRFSGAMIDIHDVNKNNGVKTGLVVRLPDNPVAPTIYLDNFFKQYEEGRELSDILTDVAKFVTEAHDNCPSFNIDEILKGDQFVAQLVSTKSNEEILSNCPHREFHDLSVIYRLQVMPEATVLVTNDVAAKIGITEEELYAKSYERSETIAPYKVRGMFETIAEMQGVDMDFMGIDAEAPEVMYVVTNESAQYGASVLLHEDVLKSVAEKLGTDKICILPSSTHEVIVIDEDQMKAMGLDSLVEMVTTINSTEVSLEDKLIDNAYVFDKDNGITPIRKDDHTAEKSMENDMDKDMGEHEMAD